MNAKNGIFMPHRSSRGSTRSGSLSEEPGLDLRIITPRTLLKETLMPNHLKIPLKSKDRNGLGKSTRKSWKLFTSLPSAPKHL